jgi:hypothetical protein
MAHTAPRTAAGRVDLTFSRDAVQLLLESIHTGARRSGLNYNSFQPREGLPFVVAGCVGGGEPPTRLALFYIDRRRKRLPGGYTVVASEKPKRKRGHWWQECRSPRLKFSLTYLTTGSGKSGERFLDPPRRVNCASRLLRGSEEGEKRRLAALLPAAGRRNDRDVLCWTRCAAETWRCAYTKKSRSGEKLKDPGSKCENGAAGHLSLRPRERCFASLV